MKHQVKGRKFGRKSDERTAFMRSLARALVNHGKIRTTQARAKELRPLIEKLITKGRVGTLASRRLVIARLGVREGSLLCSEIAPRYKDRNGGYTRIIKLPARRGDGSPMAIIELV